MQTVVRELRELISAEAIDRRVAELAEEISEHYDDQRPLLIGVLNGAVIFMADLARKLEMDLDFQFMAVSSYGAATESSGVVQILKDLDSPIEGREVLIVEDIIDSGLTVRYLRRILEQRRPANIRIVALLRKGRPEAADLQIDWVGFEIPDEFVVGYGLDLAGRFRNLPAVCIVELDEAAVPSAES